MNRFGKMGLKNVLLAVQIGNGPGNLEDAAIAARRQAETLSDLGKKLLALAVEGAERADMTRLHLGVGVELMFVEAFTLNLAGQLNPAADGLAGLATLVVDEILMIDPWYFNV